MGRWFHIDDLNEFRDWRLAESDVHNTVNGHSLPDEEEETLGFTSTETIKAY